VLLSSTASDQRRSWREESIQLQGDEQVTNFTILSLSSLIMAAALAGCSSSNYDMGPQANSTTSTQYKPANTDYMPNYMASTSIGPVMTTPQGSTVYTFDEDQIGKSNCYGECARNWPPVLAADDAQPYGRMSLASRQDGQEQWVYDGKPLYTYAEDAMHGDVKGENAGKVWHVVK
jgi:predicted lipoprotein with Yx(FWY)xxD motif